MGNRRTKVLMLGWEYPPIISGGLGVACKGIATSLTNLVDLTLFLPQYDTQKSPSEFPIYSLSDFQEQLEHDIIIEEEVLRSSQIEFIKTILLPYQSIVTTETRTIEEVLQSTRIEKNISHHQPFQIDELYGDDLVDNVIKYSQVVKKAAQTYDFDVIYAHDWMTFLAGIELQRTYKKPLVLHVHSLNYDRTIQHWDGWVYDLEKYAMQHADHVIAVSGYTKKIIQEIYHIDYKKVSTIHNGIEKIRTFKGEKGFPEKLVLFLGRVTTQKGPSLFLDIAEEIIKKNTHVRFVMAGDGEELKRTIESGAYRNISHKFHFTGHLSQKEVRKLFSIADVYCMPSISEPFGISALEATQFGIPAVISKQSGVAEVLPQAIKVDYWNKEEMVNAILHLLNHEKDRQRAINQGKKDILQLTWKNSGQKIVNQLEQSITDFEVKTDRI